MKTKLNEKNQKKIFLIFLLIAISVTFCVAQGITNNTNNSGITNGLSALKKVFGTLYYIFFSTYTLIIAAVALVWIGVKMYKNRNEPIFDTLIKWMFATILIGGASGIVQMFYTPSFVDTTLTDGTTYILNGIK